ncbi:DEAD/DEAH box helicase family protein [Salinarimonas rosea]|uniref:DEAD/DEAH box helicase family protein n=1 Tax=Salinarimonas rosea TaxID=552063 RepID=UPI0003FB3F60|nr:DEAD/DEAH box helicase family protein [Salinarimonas rosea]
MIVQGSFKLVDVDKAIPSFDERHELKEAICDALIEMTHARAGGLGPAGEVVYGVKPSDWFVSDFLLPRFTGSGRDDTSDIRIAVHGVEFKIEAGSRGTLSVAPEFAVYVRVLPTWEDLADPARELPPKPRLKEGVRRDIYQQAKSKAQAERKKDGEQRKLRDLISHFSRELMLERGIRLDGSDQRSVLIKVEEALDGRSDSEPGTDSVEAGPVAVVETLGESDTAPDNVTVEEEIPQKWRRLPIRVPEFAIDLQADDRRRGEATADYGNSLAEAIRSAYAEFLGSDDGRAWAWRPRRFPPSAFRSRERWEQVLIAVRQDAPSMSDLCPAQQPTFAVEWTPDPLDPSTISVRLALEHGRAADVGENGLFQVAMRVSVPRAALRPFTLERVRPSYSIAGYMEVDAAGVNCGVESANDEGSVALTTTWAPRYHLPRIVPNEIADFDVTYLGLSNPARSAASLEPLPDSFVDWIEDTVGKVDPERGLDPADAASRERERESFAKNIEDWGREVEALRAGIALLKESEGAFRQDPADRRAIPFRAWLLMNRTFLQAARRRGWKESEAGWRLFQLGFVLSGLTAVATRMEEFHGHYAAERDERVSLLYFATGGGKSEAFFGLLIFTLFFDRMRGKHRGVSALMRYPLRLLTAQQARRLALLLAEAEVIKADEGIGGAPFEIGFWVGGASTPNSTLDRHGKIREGLKDVPEIGPSAKAEEAKALAKDGYKAALRDYNKLPTCPFCGKTTGLRLYPKREKRLGIVCFDDGCRWNKISRRSGALEPLPFLLTDRDIYRRAPAILLGTVDKLALIGHHPLTINRLASMFGTARWIASGTGLLESPHLHDELKGSPPAGKSPVGPAYRGGEEVFVDPVPAIIVQDEAHLLEESLGTFAGLFETTLYQWFRSLRTILGSRMATVPGAPTQVRMPKVIAATATISDPEKQVEALYQREVERFPQPGPELHRSFYAAPRAFEGAAREREGWASNPADSEWLAPWARVYVSLMTNGRPHTVTTVTILSAFAAIVTRLLRDLCAPEEARKRSAVEDLVASLRRGPLRQRHEAAIRALDAAGRHDVLASVVDLHRVALTYVTNRKGGDQILSATAAVADQEHRSIGQPYVVDDLRMRLISGGVDAGEIESIVKEAERPFDPTTMDLSDALRMIVATSAISHGVDVERFNSMFFAGMPTDIAEYIQASSRVGRTHVGFVMLVPTPQARRDRYIAEVHEPFHRFLERMIAPPAIERWASRAVRRVIPSIIQNWLVGIKTQEEFQRAPADMKHSVPHFTQRREVKRLKDKLGATEFKRALTEHVLAAIGVDEVVGGAGSDRETYEALVATQIDRFVENIDEPHAAGEMDAFWQFNAAQLDMPMTSLRDVDAPGRITPFAQFGKVDALKQVKETMQFIRRGGSN